MALREHAYCGLFAALALALPVLFHALGLAGVLFLPMYWPLVVLAFLVAPHRAVMVAALVPWASAVLTGMPLVWPPLAAVLSVELAVQVAALGWWHASRVRRDAPPHTCATVVALAAVLVPGRVLHAGLVWLLAQFFPALPAGVMAGAAGFAGWPGVAVMLVFVPVFVGALSRRDGACEVAFLKALRRLRLPEGAVLVSAQTLRWCEALVREAEMLARALELRRAAAAVQPVSAPAASPVVSIEDLRVIYPGASAPALALAHFTLAPGEKVALLGPNGGGKTTLLAVLSGFVAYTGNVRVFGQKPDGRVGRAVRGRLGVLFENPDDQFLFPTVVEDVGYALARRGVPAPDVAARVAKELARLGLPPGNRPIAALSHGQRQRVALAGVLAAEPELLLLDEPTSALDEAETNRLADVLAAYPGAVLVATHNRAFAARLGARRVWLRPPRGC